jgi:hypothetical protein
VVPHVHGGIRRDNICRAFRDTSGLDERRIQKMAEVGDHGGAGLVIGMDI